MMNERKPNGCDQVVETKRKIGILKEALVEERHAN